MRSTMRMRRWLVTATVTGLVVAAGSTPITYGQSEAPAAAPAATCAEGAAAVDFWTEHTPPDSDGLQSIVDAFNAANPDVCVTMQIVPGSETDIAKLLTSIRGGVGPDIYLVDRSPSRSAPTRASSRSSRTAARTWPTSTCPSPGPRRSSRARRTPCPSIPTCERSSTTRTSSRPRARTRRSSTSPMARSPSRRSMRSPTRSPRPTPMATTRSIGWIPGGPDRRGLPGALDQGWHYTWGFAYGGSFADLGGLPGDPDGPRCRGRLPVPV